MELRIFIDESGDLGFSENSSSYFLLGGIVTFRHFQIHRIPKKIRQKLHKNLKAMPELKATKSDLNVHKKIFEELVKCDETILFFNPCKKSLIPLEIRNDPNKEMRIYELRLNQLFNVIPDSWISQSHSIHIIIDEHWKNPKRKHTLQDLIQSSTQVQSKFQNKSLNIEQINSISSNELQVVDFVINSCFRAFERDDTTQFCYLVQNIHIYNA